MRNNSAGVEVGQQQKRQLQNYIEHINSSSFLTPPLLPQCVGDEATPRMHARQTVFCQLSSIYLSLK